MSNKCDLIPRIKNKKGEWVDSLLFTSLLENLKDRELAKKAYQQVHSKEFLEWFGDWINNPSEASKVVDENGEPLVVYRGHEESIDNTSQNYLYFTNSKVEASLYSKANITKSGSITERNPIPSIESNIVSKLIYENKIDKGYAEFSKNRDMILFNAYEMEDSKALEQANKYLELEKSIPELQDLNRLKELYELVKIETEEDLDKPATDGIYIENIDEYNSLRNKLSSYFDSKNIGNLETVFLSIKNPYDNGVHEDLESNRLAYSKGKDGALLLSGDSSSVALEA